MSLGPMMAKPSPIYQAGPFRTPIASSPSIHANSATWVGYLSAGGQNRVLNMGQFTIMVYQAASSTRGVNVGNTGWGPPYPWQTAFPGITTAIPVPLPSGAIVPPGTDQTVCVEQRNSGTLTGIDVWEMWDSQDPPATAPAWESGWGGHNRLSSDGIQYGTLNGASGSCIPHTAVVIRVHELAAGWIPHPIAFSCNCVHTSTFVSPAQKTDGNNASGVATPIPEGTRFQLNPSASLSGLNRLQTVIARCLQVFGAYCYDIGGSRMAFIAERAHDANATNADDLGSVYTQTVDPTATISGGYINLDTGGTFPWSSLRALA